MDPTSKESQLEEEQKKRIAARRIRIEKRRHHRRIQEENLTEHDRPASDSGDEVAEQRESTIKECKQRLKTLSADGDFLVTNIALASEARESNRREQEDASYASRLKKLDEEAESAREKYEEVMDRWNEAKQETLCDDLRKKIEEHHRAWNEFIQQKDELIADFLEELQRKDEEYIQNLKREEEEVDLILQRITNLLRDLTFASEEELRNIEAACQLERRTILNSCQQEWEEALTQMREQETQHVVKRVQQMEHQQVTLRELHLQEADRYQQMKIQLMKDVHILEAELQAKKALFLLNEEKLEYNCHILEKREKENADTEAEQKRKIIRLQSKVLVMRDELARIDRNYFEENKRLTGDICQMTEQIQDLKKKMKHFQAVDREKFSKAWILKEDEAKDMVKEILFADQAIHDQILRIPYSHPDLSFIRNIGPVTTPADKARVTPAMELARNVFHHAALTESQLQASSQSNSSSMVQDSTMPSADQLHTMLKRLCEDTKFLVEEILQHIMEPLEPTDRYMTQLDTVFSVLNINSEADVHHVYTCMEEHTKDGSLESGDLLKSLREYLDSRQEDSKKCQTVILSNATRDSSMDENYWKCYADFVPMSRQSLWEALLKALEKYYYCLKQKVELVEQTAALSQQNRELKSLLCNYLEAEPL